MRLRGEREVILRSGLDWSKSRGQNPECWDLAVKGSSDSEPRRGAGESPQKKLGPEVNCFLFALCKGACFSEL